MKRAVVTTGMRDLFASDPRSPSKVLRDRLTIPIGVAPGSETSELAAAELRAFVIDERLKVLEWFARQSSPKTRHECAAAVYEGKDSALGSACGRINELIFQRLLEEVGRQGRRATLAITDRGRTVLGWAAKHAGAA